GAHAGFDLGAGMAHHVAFRRFDLHDLRAIVGQQLRTRRPHDDRTQVQDPDPGQRPGGGGGCGRCGHCFSTPALAARASQMPRWATVKAACSLTLFGAATMPMRVSLSTTAGRCSTALISLFQRSTMAGGVPAGAARPTHTTRSNSFKPTSAMVGTPG